MVNFVRTPFTKLFFMKSSLFLLALCCLIGSCSKHYSPADHPGSSIVFGSGGGFTGGATEYLLLENGQFFKKQNYDTLYMEAARRLNRDLVKQTFDNYEFLQLAQVQYDKPGNFYYYLEHRTPQQTSQQILWADGAKDVPPAVRTYYRNLNQLVKQAHFEE